MMKSTGLIAAIALLGTWAIAACAADWPHADTKPAASSSAVTIGTVHTGDNAPGPKPGWKEPVWPVITKGTVYTRDNAPAAAKLESLPWQKSVTQYGMTWTFDQPARVGQFVNGDYYVVGPVTLVQIDPKPRYGPEIAENELDKTDQKHAENQRVRNGFMLNPPAARKVAYDSGAQNYFDPSLIQKLPVAMKPGDSLVSTISMPMGLVLSLPLRDLAQRGATGSPTRLAAVLTCVAEPLPADAFRPAFCDRQARIYFTHNLKRELLPALSAPASLPRLELYAGYTQKPWVNTGFLTFEQPMENMPGYAREISRVVGNSALILCTDLKPEQKEPLLINLVQVGIDLGGMIRSGHPGWEALGGHGSGRKFPIVLAGLLLGDDELANINKSFPKAHFGEDEQTAYGDCWTGAKVVFAGHRAIDEATGIARAVTGPYEQKNPKDWTKQGAPPRSFGDKMSESYRRGASSSTWVAQALVLHLLKAEKTWNHEAFFDYCDRWMYEDDTEFVKIIQRDAGVNFEGGGTRQGRTWDGFDSDMWALYRTAPGLPPTDGWTKPHDDTYLRNAMQKAAK